MVLGGGGGIAPGTVSRSLGQTADFWRGRAKAASQSIKLNRDDEFLMIYGPVEAYCKGDGSTTYPLMLYSSSMIMLALWRSGCITTQGLCSCSETTYLGIMDRWIR